MALRSSWALVRLPATSASSAAAAFLLQPIDLTSARYMIISCISISLGSVLYVRSGNDRQSYRRFDGRIHLTRQHGVFARNS
jgi:hypothetical protein